MIYDIFQQDCCVLHVCFLARFLSRVLHVLSFSSTLDFLRSFGEEKDCSSFLECPFWALWNCDLAGHNHLCQLHDWCVRHARIKLVDGNLQELLFLWTSRCSRILHGSFCHSKSKEEGSISRSTLYRQLII